MVYRVIRKSLRDFRPLLYSSRDGHAEEEHVNRGTDTPSFCPTLEVLDMSTLGVCLGCCTAEFGRFGGTYELPCICQGDIGHPQTLQENRPKSFSVFLHSWIPNVNKFLLQKQNFIRLYILNLLCSHVYTTIYTFASVTETCEHMGSHNAEKRKNSWICFLGVPENDRLSRNMSP